jgi:hypothetical protein
MKIISQPVTILLNESDVLDALDEYVRGTVVEVSDEHSLEITVQIKKGKYSAVIDAKVKR